MRKHRIVCPLKGLLVLLSAASIIACGDDEQTFFVTPTATQPSPSATESVPTATAAAPTATESAPTPTTVPPTATISVPTLPTSAATATVPAATPSATEAVFLSRPPEALPPGPAPQEIGCGPDDDFCDHARTAVLAVAHAFTDPEDVVYYRVTVDPSATGTNWGDGTNGFFYQAVVNGSATSTYVPFNGVAVGEDNAPALPQFSFLVEANVAENGGELLTTLEIDLCATDYDGGSTPSCKKRLWTDQYSGLPVPAVGLGPEEDPFVALDPPTVLFSSETGSSVSVPNNGVYPGILEICPSLNGSSCAGPSDLSAAQVEWFYDHLIFFDLIAQPYTNDIFDDASAQHRSIGVLTLEEAAYPTSSTDYRTRYGGTTAITSRDLPIKQFFFYTKNSSTTAITAGVQYLYDADDCNGNLNSVGCGSSTVTGEVSIMPAASISPQTGLNGNLVAAPVDQNDTAGTVSTRTIAFQGRGTNNRCTEVVNPLAVNPSGLGSPEGDLQPNRPNYVIDDAQNATTLWTKRFAPGLYYVPPAGFGNCASGEQPFCHLSSNYVAYVPQYTRDSAGGELNGGSTDQSFVDELVLADQYGLQGLATSEVNALVYFDNCGYGYVYEECTGSVSCTYALGTRKASLPSPPSGFSKYTYGVTNARDAAVVFGKECCASWYQTNSQTKALEPAVQIRDGFGVFVGPGASFTYETLFKDEAISVYDAATGNRSFKLRLTPSDTRVYGCADPSSSASISGSGTSWNVALRGTAQGQVPCYPVGPCPFGADIGQDEAFTTCTWTHSSFLLGLEDWAAENLESGDSIEIVSWGASGNGPSDSEAGNGAGGGRAATILAESDLDGVKALYAYVAQAASGLNGGGKGGSSTIVSEIPLSSIAQDTWKGVTARPDNSGVLVIAGGGGGGGDFGLSGFGTKVPGGNGGAGATATARSSSPQTVNGNNGGSGNSGGGGGSGGSPTETSGATGGVGGFGGGSTKWRTGGALIPPTSWSPGAGQSNGSGRGQGGGGFGGGHEGGLKNGSGGGGGGGASFAAASSGENVFFTCAGNSCSDSIPGSPNGGSGAARLRYLARETRPVLYRVNAGGPQLTATDGGPPWVVDTDFLTATGQETDDTTEAIDIDHPSLFGVAAPMELFQTERRHAPETSVMTWAFPVLSGDVVEIRLLLAEIGGLARGLRVFDVRVEGGVPSAFAALDPAALGNGALMATMVAAHHTMADDTLNLEFDLREGDPVIQGIEIVRVGTRNVVVKPWLWTQSNPNVTDCLSLDDAGVVLSNQNHELIWQSDGDLVLYDGSRTAIWRSNTALRASELCFQGDGNLVILDSAKGVVWAANTADGEHGGNGGRRMILGDDCDLTIVNPSGTALFRTETTCSSSALPTFTPTHTPSPSPTFTVGTPIPTLPITDGPTESPFGGGSCSVTGNPCQDGGATVTCTGLDPAAVDGLYYGLRNDRFVIADSQTGFEPVAESSEVFRILSAADDSIVYEGATTIFDVVTGEFHDVETRLVLTFQQGTGSLVDASGNPPDNGNGDIRYLWKVSGAAFTVGVDVQSRVGSGSFGNSCPVFDASMTTHADADSSHVDLGFYYGSLPTPTSTPSPTSTPTRTHTHTATRTHTRTRTPTPSHAPTATFTPRDTATATPTSTSDATATPTASPSPTPLTVEVQSQMLTSTNQPVPAACLLLPNDTGVVLDNNVAQLVWQTDGNLELLQGGDLLWESATSVDDLGANAGVELCFEGVLSILDSGGFGVFSTQTFTGQTLRLDSNCNLSILSNTSAVLWETGTSCNP